MKRANPYPGVHRVPVRLADGSKKVYFYAWPKGPRLPDNYGSPEFAAAYRDAIATKAPLDRGTLQKVLDAYQRSPSGDGTGKAFQDLAKRTQLDYARHIAVIEQEFGSMPISALSDPRARRTFLEWRDRLAERSRRQADYAFTVLSRILAWAYGRRMIPANPCERAGRLYRGSRAEKIWLDADIVAFEAIASEPLKLAMRLALWTGQRQGDLLSMTWRCYDGDTIRVTQGKTGARVVIPVSEVLREELEKSRKVSPIILTNTKGSPWTAHGFSSSWRKTAARAGIADLTFHDLRGTAVTRLALAGCSHAEIGAITGHGSAEVSAILEKHYLARDPELAKSAIAKLEKRTNPPK